MLIHDKKMMYFPTVRTGSRTILNYLIAHHNCSSGSGVLMQNSQDDCMQGIDQQEPWTPKEYQEYDRFLSVRNPYERVYSYWRYETQVLYPERMKGNIPQEIFPGNCGQTPLSFFEFIHALITNKKEYDVDPLTMSEIYHYGSCSAFVRLEHLESDLGKVLNEKMPPLGVTNRWSERSFFEEFKDCLDEAKEWVLDYCEEDFELFGYDL